MTATTDVDALLATDADCVLYSPFIADPAVVTAILESGKNVVTPLGWFYPPPEEREQFDAIARSAGVTLHGTGIHPGGITERFPLMISALSGSITHVRAEEFSDIRTYGAPDVVRDWMLFGKTPEEARTSIMADALGAGFRQSVFMVADELGFDIDPQLRTTHEMAVATAPIDSPIGPIQPGTVAAQRFTWEALVDGEPVVTAAVNWLMGEEHLDPAWKFGPDGRALRGRGHRRPELPHHLQEAAPRDGRGGPRPQPGHRRDRHALRQRDSLRLRGRARPAHLPRPAAGGRPRRSGLAPGPAGRVDRRPGMILDRFSIDGRVAIVTGAGLGIGRGIAIGLAEAGADVVLAARTESDLEEVAGHVRDLGRRALVVPTDVTDAAACEQLVAAHRRGVRSARHPRQQRRRRDAPGRDGHERRLHGAHLRLQRDRAADAHQAGGAADGRHRRAGRRRQHLVALGQHDPDDVRRLRRGQGRARPDDAQHRARARPAGAGQRH